MDETGEVPTPSPDEDARASISITRATWTMRGMCGYIAIKQGEVASTRVDQGAQVNIDYDAEGEMLGVEVILGHDEITPQSIDVDRDTR